MKRKIRKLLRYKNCSNFEDRTYKNKNAGYLISTFSKKTIIKVFEFRLVITNRI